MLKLAWATDLHFDMAQPERFDEFVAEVKKWTPSPLLIAGDISSSETVEFYLKRLRESLEMPIYFVLGNHDFYGGLIHEVRKKVLNFSQKFKDFHYLTYCGVIPLTPQTALIGHDGWADGKAGDYKNSTTLVRDYIEIGNFVGLQKNERLKALNQLGEEAAAKVRKDLEEALKNYSNVILLIHAPPSMEACFYQNKPATPDWAPHFVSQSVGDAILDIMKVHPNSKLTVLAGHTHHFADIHLIPNLHIIVGAAKYGDPRLQPIIIAQ